MFLVLLEILLLLLKHQLLVSKSLIKLLWLLFELSLKFITIFFFSIKLSFLCFCAFNQFLDFISNSWRKCLKQVVWYVRLENWNIIVCLWRRFLLKLIELVKSLALSALMALSASFALASNQKLFLVLELFLLWRRRFFCLDWHVDRGFIVFWLENLLKLWGLFGRDRSYAGFWYFFFCKILLYLWRRLCLRDNFSFFFFHLVDFYVLSLLLG